MLIRIVRMTFDPEKVEEFNHIFEESKDKIRAREGCLHLELWRDWHQDNVFVTHSHWESEEALNAYRGSELFRITWKKNQSPVFGQGFGIFGDESGLRKKPDYFGGLIIICARCVPGSMIQGIAGPSGLRGSPVLSAVAKGMYTT